MDYYFYFYFQGVIIFIVLCCKKVVVRKLLKKLDLNSTRQDSMQSEKTQVDTVSASVSRV